MSVPKIFCVGLDKTGTTSLGDALRILGYSVWQDKQIRERCESGDYGFPEYDALIDRPLWRYLDGILEHHPDCRIIVTEREKESWIRSRILHVFRNRMKGHYWNEIDTDEWSSEYDHHQRVMRDLELRHPHVLRIRICEGEGWEKLGRFIGADRLPGQGEGSFQTIPFPRVNTGMEILKEIQELLGQGNG